VEGLPYVAIPDLKDGRIDLSEVRLISPEDFAVWTTKTLPRAGDIIVTRRGRVGDTAVVPGGLQCALGQDLVILRSNGRHVDRGTSGMRRAASFGLRRSIGSGMSVPSSEA
jgi:type I restriction enzyme S subunit